MSADRKKKITNVTFKQVLHALLDLENVFPPGYIHKLSDLDSKQVKDLQAVWGKIPLERRRTLLEDMEDFGSSDFLLNFSPVAHLALDDVDGRVRAFGLQILRDDEEPANITLFSRMMENDPEEAVRSAAALAFGPLVYAGEIEEIPEAQLHQVEDALLAKYHSSDGDEVRRSALESFGYSGRPELSAMISESYQRGTQNWLISALRAMGRTASAEWTPQVMASLQDKRPLVRAEAASAAGELELSDSVPALLGLLDDASPEVRAACIWSLSQIGGEGVREQLEKLAAESEDEEELDLLDEALENLDFNEKFTPALFDLDNLDEMGDEDEDMH